MESEKEFSEKDMSPWMSKTTKSIGDTLLRFHNEIIEFYNYIKPSKKNHASRMKKFNL
jgi:non-canonical poly(A) RNA polymerase PAPD5/7